jgi:hypothetical protein
MHLATWYDAANQMRGGREMQTGQAGKMPEDTPRRNIAPSEITVRDGHLTIKLAQMETGWYAIVESEYEGKIFEGRVTELSDLLAGNIPQLGKDDEQEPFNLGS